MSSVAPLLLAVVACGCGSTTPPPAVRHAGAGGRSAFDGVGVIAPEACTGDASAPAPGPNPDPLCAGARTDVTFQRDVAPLVACSGEACHPPWRYDTLVGRPSQTCCDRRLIVEPGSPSSSHLYQAIAGVDSCVGRMGALSDAGVATVVAWICEGAPDD